MFSKKSRWISTSIALFVVGLAFLIFPPYGQYCDTQQANNYYCAAYSVTVTLGEWVDAHNGALTAIFTIVLAVSTIFLWWATKGLYEAGEKQLEIADIMTCH